MQGEDCPRHRSRGTRAGRATSQHVSAAARASSPRPYVRLHARACAVCAACRRTLVPHEDHAAVFLCLQRDLVNPSLQISERLVVGDVCHTEQREAATAAAAERRQRTHGDAHRFEKHRSAIARPETARPQDKLAPVRRCPPQPTVADQCGRCISAIEIGQTVKFLLASSVLQTRQ